jgi:hypothetical protein
LTVVGPVVISCRGPVYTESFENTTSLDIPPDGLVHRDSPELSTGAALNVLSQVSIVCEATLLVVATCPLLGSKRFLSVVVPVTKDKLIGDTCDFLLLVEFPVLLEHFCLADVRVEEVRAVGTTLVSDKLEVNRSLERWDSGQSVDELESLSKRLLDLACASRDELASESLAL